MPKHTKLLTAIDIGTEKIATVIASVQATGDISVLGVSVLPSKGMKKSQIVDLEAITSVLEESVDAAERMAGIGIKSATVSISGAHIDTINSKGVVAVAHTEGEIVDTDVTRVLEAAQAVSLPSSREILHVVPRDFKVDSQEGIKDPRGMSGVRLEAEAHIITGASTSLKNIVKCVNDVGVQVETLVYSGLAASQSTLSETEKELGVALVDIGAGSTAISVYVDGSLAHSKVLPVGARHITSDIALGLRVSLQSAEIIKLALSKLPPISLTAKPNETREEARQRKKSEDSFDVTPLGLTDISGELSKKAIIDGIIIPRLTELFRLIERELSDKKLMDLVPAGIVLTGGGAETVAIQEACKNTMRLPCRVGSPTHLHGLIEDIIGPQYATTVGLLLYAKDSGLGSAQEQPKFSLASLKKIPLSAAPALIKKIIGRLFP